MLGFVSNSAVPPCPLRHVRVPVYAQQIHVSRDAHKLQPDPSEAQAPAAWQWPKHLLHGSEEGCQRPHLHVQHAEMCLPVPCARSGSLSVHTEPPAQWGFLYCLAQGDQGFCRVRKGPSLTQPSPQRLEHLLQGGEEGSGAALHAVAADQLPPRVDHPLLEQLAPRKEVHVRHVRHAHHALHAMYYIMIHMLVHTIVHHIMEV